MARPVSDPQKQALAGPSPPYLSINRAAWERAARWYERRHALALRRYGGKAWGAWRVPESKLRLLGDIRGKDVLELGCGSAGWSIALAREGARVVGLDLSPLRLRQAQARMNRARVSFRLVEASADRIPFPARTFDVVLSDYGATTFADPYRTIPEVARVLRKGGILVFAHHSPFRTLAWDTRKDRQTRRLQRDYFGLHVVRYRDSVEFQLPYGEWIRLFSDCGLIVERLEELSAPRRWRSSYFSRPDQEWARRWPAEAIWKVRKGSARRPRAGGRAARRPPRPRGGSRRANARKRADTSRRR